MYSRITASKNGRAAIRYARGKGPGKNGRCVLITTINMLPGTDYADQMTPLWKRVRANHTTQVRRIIISFSKNELDPENAADIETANTIVKEFIKTYYPDRQAVLFYQNDGTGGCLHCHAIVNDVSLTDHKACTRTQGHYTYVRKGIDNVAAKYITLDDGGKSASRQTHTERAKAEKAAVIMEGYPELQDEALRRVLMKEKAYSYKEDMKQRIHEAALSSTDEDTFFDELKARGISAIKKTSAKYGEHYVYNFDMCPVGVKNTRARSYKLGYSFSPEAVRMLWQKKEQQDDHKPTKAPADDFTTWLQQQGLSCFEYDPDGKLVGADFDLMDELHEKYLGSSTLDDISAQAKDIKETENRKARIRHARVQRAEVTLKVRKEPDRQYEFSL